MYPIPFYPYASFFKFAGFLIYLYSSSSSLNPLSLYRNKLKFLLNDSRFARGVHGHQVIISFMSHVATADHGALPHSDTDWRHLLLTQQSSSFRGVSLCERTRERCVMRPRYYTLVLPAVSRSWLLLDGLGWLRETQLCCWFARGEAEPLLYAMDTLVVNKYSLCVSIVPIVCQSFW